MKREQKTKHICGHITKEEKEYNLLDESSCEEFVSDVKKQSETQNTICEKCKKAGLVSASYNIASSYDQSSFTYLFRRDIGVRALVHYCRKNEISLHDQYFNVNSMYDCTGKCFHKEVNITKGKKYFTITITHHYDV